MSTRAVPVKDLEPFIGRHVSFTFCDGWEEWACSGVLLSLDSPPDYHLTYVSYCDCDEPCNGVPDEHGACAMPPDGLVRVRVGGR